MAITDRRRRRIIIGSGIAAVALLAGTSPLWATYLGRQIPWLEVDKVEIAGTHLLAPHEVLAASGIRDGQHLLDERTTWESSLLQNPVIASARVTRKLPNTLRVTVQEKRPVALVEDETLRLVTSTGEILPLDPAVVQVDLPIVHGSLSDSTSSLATHRLLAETERLSRLDPALMSEVSEIRAASEDGSTLVLVLPNADVILSTGATAARTAQLRAVLGDVAGRIQLREGDGSSAPVRVRLDLRFGDQIVVAPMSSAEIS
jgi:cell division protein FtsQ